jgi:signal transduction histidine kinase
VTPGDARPPAPGDRLRAVAHELRSPVAALSALADAAPAVPPAERRRLLLLGLAAARDVERILGDADVVAVRLRERVDLGDLAAGFAGDGVRISALGPVPVLGDPTRLRQVIANLVANALRHGTRAEIDVRTQDGRALLEVADDGPGVADGIDPFARGASGAGSSGLGLWLGRAIAEAHGGSLDLVPGTGRGARFRLALPSASDAD